MLPEHALAWDMERTILTGTPPEQVDVRQHVDKIKEEFNLTPDQIEKLFDWGEDWLTNYIETKYWS